jgi:hypothetical protein
MTTTLVHRGEQALVSAAQLILKCSLFKDNLSLLVAPYTVKSSVSLDIFRLFLSALNDAPVEITRANFSGLSLLSKEFGFDTFSAQLADYRSSAGLTDQANDNTQIAALEERVLARDRDIAALQAEVARLSSVVEESRFSARADALAAAQARIEAAVERVSSAVEALCARVAALEAQLAVAPAGFDSVIVPQFPPLLTEFRGKRFGLLWRGSGNGFRAGDFHGRCDGHTNTLTLIQDTAGNVFGGFTPVAWESRNLSYKKCLKGDASRTAFVFTLKNPHNAPARRFALKPDMTNEAIFCQFSFGPHFCDLVVLDEQGRSNRGDVGLTGCSSLGNSYVNDTGRDGKTFFTGSDRFTVKEIEVFEIIN